MKNTAKRITAVLALAALMLSLASCGNKAFKCDFCMEEKTGKSYTSQVLGQEITICEDCHESLNELVGGK